MNLSNAQLTQLFSVDSDWTYEHINKALKLASHMETTPESFEKLVQKLRRGKLSVTIIDRVAERLPREKVVFWEECEVDNGCDRFVLRSIGAASAV